MIFAHLFVASAVLFSSAFSYPPVPLEKGARAAPEVVWYTVTITVTVDAPYQAPTDTKGGPADTVVDPLPTSPPGQQLTSAVPVPTASSSVSSPYSSMAPPSPPGPPPSKKQAFAHHMVCHPSAPYLRFLKIN